MPDICDRILSKQMPTLTIDADQFIGIKRQIIAMHIGNYGKSPCVFPPGSSELSHCVHVVGVWERVFPGECGKGSIKHFTGG